MSGGRTTLWLHEEIMLLALRDQEGTVAAGAMYPYAIGGAILAELLLADRIAVDEGRKRLVSVMNEKPMGDPLLDEGLERIATAKRRAAAQTWVQRFAHFKRLKHRVAEGLCRRGVLRADEDTVLLLFRRKIYPELDPRPERKLIERLRNAIFGDGGTVDSRISVLVSLASSADVLRIPFDKKDLRRRKDRIKQLSDGQLVGKATRDAVQAAQAAAAMAAIIPAIAVTTVAH